MLNNLKSLITTPFVTPAGVVTRPGYHGESETYADFAPDLMADFPTSPSRAELVAALRQIWRPVCAFTFAADADRGAMLAAIVGSLARPGYDLAPGVLVEAPCQGSGKTLCAQAVGAIQLGRRPPITPFAGDDDAELKKQMVANALDGFDYMLLDNVVGMFDSAVMAGVLTSGTLRDRVLGASLMFDGCVRMNIMLTSNNAALSRDLHRRFIRVRLDTGVERPQALEFDFDPIERALSERLAIARAVCVLVQGFFAAGSPRIGRGDAGFPAWSRLVRDCVLWCQREGLSEEAGVGVMGDPAHPIIEEAGRSDIGSHALGMLLGGLYALFGSETWYARDIARVIECPPPGAGDDVKEALDMLMPASGKSRSLVSIGHALRFRIDVHCSGLVLRSLPGANHSIAYRVQKT